MAATREIVIACETCREIYRGSPQETFANGWEKTARGRWRCKHHRETDPVPEPEG